MRRWLLRAVVVLATPLLAACSAGATPRAIAPGPHQVDVAKRSLVAFKRQTAIPDCPEVPSKVVDKGMPAVTLPCLGGGRAVDVAGLRGPMIVNFWASWCGDCRKEMPALATYAKNHPAVKVVGIDFLDQQPGAALELAKASHVGYPLLADTQGALDTASPLPHIPGLPLTVFLDRRGAIVHIEAGAMLTEHDVEAAAATYLGTRG